MRKCFYHGSRVVRVACRQEGERVTVLGNRENAEGILSLSPYTHAHGATYIYGPNIPLMKGSGLS